MNLFPEKYWPVQDERLIILKRYLDSLEIPEPALLSTEEIIEICIKQLETFTLSEEEKFIIKNLIIAQNQKVLDPAIDSICEEVARLESDEIVLVSLGCGNESLFERQLDERIKEDFPNIKTTWLGLDVGDFRDPGSFFIDKPFRIIKESKVTYFSFVEKTTSPVLLLGRYSYHHIGIGFEDFLERCTGFSKVLLIEEPVTSEKWELADYRIMRIAYDVLANTVFVVNWAKAFLKDPSLFKVDYIKLDKLSKQVKIWRFKDVLPETALIIAEP